MPPWVFWLVLAPVCGQFATVPKSVISLHPPWTMVFQGETVNLTCNGFHFYAPEKTKWYKRWYHGRWYQREERETQGNTLEVRASGEYRCQAQGLPLSDPVHLTFSQDSFILQAPHSVFEGDALVLRCRKRGKEKLTSLTYTWNRKTLLSSNKSVDLLIQRASLNHSGTYQCIGSAGKQKYVFRSNSKLMKIQELFSRPELRVTAFQPREGSSVNLSCETRLAPERLDTPLHFLFFRDSQVLGPGGNGSSELHIPTIWREDSGSYECGAGAVALGVHKRSLPLQIHVQGIPVSQVSMETQPPGDQAVEGEMLVLVCSVAEGTGDTNFSWHRADMKESLGRKALRSWRAELEIRVVGESHTGGYYCTADNGYGPVHSEVVNVTVRVTPGNRSSLVSSGVAGGSLGILLAVALLFFCWHQRKSGVGFQEEKTRSPPAPGARESSPSSCPAQAQQRLSSDNVHPEEGDLVYAEIQTVRLGEEDPISRPANEWRPGVLRLYWESLQPVVYLGCSGPAVPCPSTAPSPGTAPEDEHASVVYAEVKTQLPVSSEDKDATGLYETVLFL